MKMVKEDKMDKSLLNKTLVLFALCFSFSTTYAELIGHTKETIKSITIPEKGIVLSSDTILRANIINLNGQIETLGHKLFIDTKKLNIGENGRIVGFTKPALAQVLVPQEITFVPAKAGRNGMHGATGFQGRKGSTGYAGVDARQDSKSITVYAKEISGQLYINANGEQGGKGGKGGKGGRGGDGGDGLGGSVNAKWDHCASPKNGGNAGRGGAQGLGGDGGVGGRGGNNIEVIFRSDDVTKDKAIITSLAGLGGLGGEVGEYGDPGQAGGAGSGGKDTFEVGFKFRECETSAGASSTAGEINESLSAKETRVGAKGEQTLVRAKEINSDSALELSNLKENFSENLIRFQLSRLFHKNKLELYSYLAGRAEFNYDDFDDDLKESLFQVDKSTVLEFRDFLKEKLIPQISKKQNEYKSQIEEIVSVLDLLEKSMIDYAYTKIKDQINLDEKKLLSKIDDLITECLDYREVTRAYYLDLVPIFAKIPTCEVGGLTNLRNDFFAKLEINQSYKPTAFPKDFEELIDKDKVEKANREIAQVIIETIIINNQKLKVSNFKDALNINEDEYVVTSYEVSKKSELNLKQIITNFKIDLAALEVLNE